MPLNHIVSVFPSLSVSVIVSTLQGPAADHDEIREGDQLEIATFRGGGRAVDTVRSNGRLIDGGTRDDRRPRVAFGRISRQLQHRTARVREHRRARHAHADRRRSAVRRSWTTLLLVSTFDNRSEMKRG